VKHFVLAAVCGLWLFVCVCGGKAKEGASAKLLTGKDSVSYIIGTNIAASLENIKDKISLDVLVAGLRDKLNGRPLQLKPEEAQALMQGFSARMQKEQEDKKGMAAKDNLKKGAEFLEKNKTKEGVKTTSSGLQYSVVKQGKGPKPTEKDMVEVHYKGTTIDGTEFDSSYKRGQPVSFPVNGVIKGWTEALLLMNVGSKFELVVPSELAYGERGAGQAIGPNEVLLFEVELLGIKK
jgi:FKBP-type peptidyl-prolyl cis-trans isomerase